MLDQPAVSRPRVLAAHGPARREMKPRAGGLAGRRGRSGRAARQRARGRMCAPVCDFRAFDRLQVRASGRCVVMVSRCASMCAGSSRAERSRSIGSLALRGEGVGRGGRAEIYASRTRRKLISKIHAPPVPPHPLLPRPLSGINDHTTRSRPHRCHTPRKSDLRGAALAGFWRAQTFSTPRRELDGRPAPTDGGRHTPQWFWSLPAPDARAAILRISD